MLHLKPMYCVDIFRHVLGYIIFQTCWIWNRENWKFKKITASEFLKINLMKVGGNEDGILLLANWLVKIPQIFQKSS